MADNTAVAGVSLGRADAPWLGAVGLASAATLAAFVSRSTHWMRAASAHCCKESHRSEVLSLYRRILRTAQDWPSIKRAAVILEIRDEFRLNLSESDPQRTEHMVAQARSGLRELLLGAGEAARARATPSAPKGAWPPGGELSHQRGGADKWALDELGLSAPTTMSEAKLAYHARAKASHPDSGTPLADAEAFKRVQRAWEHVKRHLPRSEERTTRQA